MYKNLCRIAAENPEMRRHIVPLLRRHASSCTVVTGNDRVEYMDAVWDMYVKTYHSIGLIVTSARGLITEFPHWELCIGSDGTPHSFGLSKPTSFGLKAGLSGSDGTPEGKAFTITNLRTKFKTPGYYGEVSHKVKDIALAAGAPVVCASLAAKVLGKEVTPLDDGVSYRRNISGVGPVVKVMVGHPRGVPTTDYNNPHCPSDGGIQASDITDDDIADVMAHYACMACE